MGIEDIKKNLFKKGAPESARPPEEQEPVFFRGQDFVPPSSQPSWIKEGPTKRSLSADGLSGGLSLFSRMSLWAWHHRLGLYATVATVALVIIGGLAAIFFFGGNAFIKKDVVVTLDGPPYGSSGQQVTYSLHYQNKTSVMLHNAVAVVVFPAGSVVSNPATQYGPTAVAQTIGDIPPGSSGDKIFQGSILGAKNDMVEVQAFLHYQPQGISSDFENDTSASFTINDVPLAVVVNLPQRAVVGQPYNFSIDYNNTSDSAFSNMFFQIAYPDGFSFQSASPTPITNNNQWMIPNINSQTSGSIQISGMLSGNNGESKMFEVQVGSKDPASGQLTPFVDTQSSTSISSSLLTVTQNVNGSRLSSMSAGDTLNWDIHYTNTTNLGLQNVQITTKFVGNLLDFSTFNLTSGGSFDSQTQQLTWRAADVPALALLAPGASGDIKFSVHVKDTPPVFTINDKNLSESITTSITSPSAPKTAELGGVPVGNDDTLNIKLNSKILFVSKGLRYSGPFSNTGPIPPKVGQATTYTIVWQVTNWSSDLSNVKVTSGLPSGVQWAGEISPSNAPLTYDPTSGNITWIPGTVPAGAGVTGPVEQVAFKVSLVPSVNQVGQSPTLVNQTLFSGQDSFTNRIYQVLTNAVSTNLTKDPSFPFGAAYVQQ